MKALSWVVAVSTGLMLLPWGLVLAGGLAAATSWLFLVFMFPICGAAGLIAMLGVWLKTRRWSRPQVAGFVTSTAVAIPGLWSVGILPLAYPAAPPGPVARVRVPSARPMRVAWGGDTHAKNYHVLYPDQRFAYDLLVEPAGIGSLRLEDFGCYGTEVLSPAAGRVVIAHDGEPDQPPGDVQEVSEPRGNFVAIELASKTYLVLAHLQAGSLRVAAGEEVHEGRILGLCGNSGRTSEPHLHMHHQRQDPRDFPHGIAEGLPLEFRDHGGPTVPEGGVESVGDRVEFRGPIISHIGRGD